MKYFPFLPSSDHGEDQLLANCFATPTKKNKIGKSRREPQELDVRGENQENQENIISHFLSQLWTQYI